MCWGRTLEGIHRLGDIDVFPKLSMEREPTTDDYKSQGTQMDSRILFQNKWFDVDGMESAGRRELMHPPSTDTRYSTMLYNVEELNKQHVHETVTIPRMANMQSQYNWGMTDSGFKFLRTRAWGEWWLKVGNMESLCKMGHLCDIGGINRGSIGTRILTRWWR